jgi:hypothetical protein
MTMECPICGVEIGTILLPEYVAIERGRMRTVLCSEACAAEYASDLTPILEIPPEMTVPSYEESHEYEHNSGNILCRCGHFANDPIHQVNEEIACGGTVATVVPTRRADE